ncbi:hypothetical protein HPB51_001881 [Rhipicephalus microplus]|uniref:Uncharacterized protein n=1 Tax=Rhipicephalus microplus TaxID=6941 RepID=A0A9J6E534_RHIMP|nr:hypothetical protein HPB51_001881 [Rhipicephalus microplus]
MTPKHLRQIYFRSIERMIVYGAQIYFPPICKRNKKNTEKVEKLKAIQRNPLSKIAKASYTASNASLNIICNIPPIHLTIERENRLFIILNADGKFVFENKEFGKEEIATKIRSSRIHPAKKRKYDYVKTIGEADYSFYTDGSQQENRCGGTESNLNRNSADSRPRSRRLRCELGGDAHAAESCSAREAAG